MTLCDLCGRARVCSPRQIGEREYDICSACWRSLQSKLRGKGRPLEAPDLVLLPRTITPEPPPGAPPNIVGQR